MKIRVLMPLYKRPEVTRFCLERLKEIKSEHEIAITCVISEEDWKGYLDDKGIDWAWAENDPLGKKINEGVKATLAHEFDYLMVMNSDNVFDAKLLIYYKTFFESLNPYFGIDRITFVNWYTKEARDFSYDYSVLGACKCIRRDVVEKAMKFGYLYPPEKNRGLDDGMMDNMIHNLGVYPTIVKYEGQLAWDFKSETNIWNWEFFKDKGKAVEYKTNAYGSQGD